MASNQQLPGELHVTIQKGDAWKIDVDFNLDLTGWVKAAAIHPKDGSADVTLATTDTNLAAGQFSILLTIAQSAALAADAHSWCLVMTPPYVDPAPAMRRTYLSGRFITKEC